MAKESPGANADLELILQHILALEERIARLEGVHDAAIAVAADFAVAPAAAHAGPPSPTPKPAGAPATPAPPAEAGEIPDEVLLVLSAAVAAFLGERAHVKQVRLLHSDAWAQQGRVSVMASHRWAVHR